MSIDQDPESRSKKVSVCPESHAKWYCLNGATCFSITIGNSTLYNCWCPTGYHGLRCDYKYISNHTSFNEAAQSLDDSNYNQLSISLALGPPNRNVASDKRLGEERNLAERQVVSGHKFTTEYQSSSELLIRILFVSSILIAIVFLIKKGLPHIANTDVLNSARRYLNHYPFRFQRQENTLENMNDVVLDSNVIDHHRDNNLNSVHLDFEMVQKDSSNDCEMVSVYKKHKQTVEAKMVPSNRVKSNNNDNNCNIIGLQHNHLSHQSSTEIISNKLRPKPRHSLALGIPLHLAQDTNISLNNGKLLDHHSNNNHATQIMNE